MFNTPTTKIRQCGFSIIEWMIVVLLILFISAVIFSIFVKSRVLTHQAMVRGEQNENGRVALQVIENDLKHAYFFAQATGDNKDIWANIPSIVSDDDCLDNANIGSFPNAAKFRPVWASSVPTGGTTPSMSCIQDSDGDTSLVEGSDYISVKRIRGLEQSSSFDEDKYYLSINVANISVHKGDASALTDGSVDSAWQYLHRVYYLDQEDGIPRLRRLYLDESKMKLDAVIAEGIEDMQFMFVLDHFNPLDRDGSADSIVSSSEVTGSDWDTGRVIGIKINLLVRSLQEVPGYTNTTQYELGDKSYTAPGDGYKRSVLSRVLRFSNTMRQSNEE